MLKSRKGNWAKCAHKSGPIKRWGRSLFPPHAAGRQLVHGGQLGTVCARPRRHVLTGRFPGRETLAARGAGQMPVGAAKARREPQGRHTPSFAQVLGPTAPSISKSILRW